MRKIHLLAALAALLITAPAATQTPFVGLVFPPNTVMGNPTSQSAFGQAIPFAVFSGSAFQSVTGDVTFSSAGVSTISNNAVSNAKFRQSGPLSVIGRSANSTGNAADITCSAAGDGVLRESGSTVGCGSINLATAGAVGSTVLRLVNGGSGVNAGPQNYIVSATAVNMNSVADTAFTIPLPSGYTRYRVQSLMITHASADLTAATTVQYGLFTATGGGGTAVVSATASTVSSTAESTSNNAQYINASITATFNNATLQFRVTTAHGSAATADVHLQIQPVL